MNDNYGINFKEPSLQRRTKDNSLDSPGFDYEGDIRQNFETINLDFKGETIFELTILDSLRLKVKRSLMDDSKNDTLFRVTSEYDDHLNLSHLIWIYTFYINVGQNSIQSTDIENQIALPIKPMWTFYDKSDKIFKQYYDTTYLHPLTKKYRTNVKF